MLKTAESVKYLRYYDMFISFLAYSPFCNAVSENEMNFKKMRKTERFTENR